MSVVLPEPHPPKIPTANLGSLSVTILVRAVAVRGNPRAGPDEGESSKIFAAPGGCSAVLIRLSRVSCAGVVMAKSKSQYQNGDFRDSRLDPLSAHELI